MREAQIVAYMSTTASRREVRAETVRNLEKTDWNAAPVLVLDQQRFPDDRGLGSTDNGREALERAAGADGWDLVLFLEDDLEFNRHLRHNLQHWPPIVALEPGGHFCGSLYDPNIGSLDPAQDGETYRIVDPTLPYGSQAVVFSRPTVNAILDGYRRYPALSDITMFHLAAREGPIHYHLPSLVQHRPVPSVWGGVAHRAENYSADFRADDVRW